ncbi:MAG: hypothetical protein JSV19_03535 [Phycisphaerales bacterium]|nr:MAG: hypothetical protein JSV19_03535 [Phycisphaerales bacterium]
MVSVSETAPVRVDLDHGFYLVSRAAGFADDVPLPLVICLHGTKTTAADILSFWTSFDHTLPLVVVAPQGVHAGWRDSDRALLREFLDDLPRTLSYDKQRVLLTGHSAGGAMAFHLLYVEGFPATAVAVTANYVPPTVESEHVHAHKDVPVFYAVGERDVNRARMRKGLALLRDNGVSVTVRRPQIGHVLDRSVGQEAMTWFESLCRSRTEEVLAAARASLQDDRAFAPSACALEEIVRVPSIQFSDQVESANALLMQIRQPGYRMLARADRLLRAGRPLEARSEILKVEQRYRSSSLEAEARRRRQRIEAMPKVAELLRLQRSLEQGSPPLPSAESRTGNH